MLHDHQLLLWLAMVNPQLHFYHVWNMQLFDRLLEYYLNHIIHKYKRLKSRANLGFMREGCFDSLSSGLASSQSVDSEKVINDVILVGSINNACSLAAVVSRCPALGVTMQTLLHELPQVLLLYWHWNTTGHSKKLSRSINSNSRMEKLT